MNAEKTAEKTENKAKGSNGTEAESALSRGIGNDYFSVCFACEYGGYERRIKDLIRDMFVDNDVKEEGAKKEVEAYMKKLTPVGIERIKNTLQPTKLMTNVSWLVPSKEAGERIVKEMFGNQARLDYREHEPNWIQVKAGACPEHELNLKKLNDETIKESNTITKEMVDGAKSRILLR